MIPALLGRKIGMTQVFGEDGAAIPVTVVQAGPCAVMQVRRHESDGYDAVQLGFSDVKPHRSTKPLIGHAVKAGTTPKYLLREVRLDPAAGGAEHSPGDIITVSIFADNAVKYVDVAGTTKGHGFTGVMKRHGFGGMPGSHGTERKHRCPGSIASHATNRGHGGNIKKGKRMSGQHGNARRTVKNQKLIKVDVENNLLLIEGAVPGPEGGYVFVRQAKTKS